VGRLLHSFLLMLAAATDKALARQVRFLKAENSILLAKLPKRITVTPAERRRLVKLGHAVGPAIKDLIGIVSPRTFARWASGEVSGTQSAQPAHSEQPAKSGRPRTADELRELVQRLARENEWGYTRILGELKKLGVGKICRSTVVNILRQAGLDPGPKRGEGTWDEFVKRHAKTLWACDFFSKKVWTMAGLVDVFVVSFLHVGCRKVFVAA
jgi:putative transposase